MSDTQRRPWTPPRLIELPKLTQLTLASAIGGGGGTGGSGSTVFGLLLAVGLLAGCSADRAMTPDEMPRPGALVAVPCRADVQARTVTCEDGPAYAGGQEILGGQGKRIGLRATDVLYTPGTEKFTFNVTVENYGTQTIGNDGTGPDAVRVYFESAPVRLTGSGGPITIEADSFGTVTAANQHYYKYPGEILSGDVSDPVAWQFDMPATVLTFGFTVLVAADVPDFGGLLRWVPFAGLTSFSAIDVAAGSATDVMAVSGFGASMRWTDPTTAILPTVGAATFVAVRPLTSGTYVAVDGVGRIWRFDGNLWSVWHELGPTMEFHDIWVYNANWFIAVGSLGAVVHTATGFKALEGPPALYRVSGSDTTNVVVSDLSADFHRRTAAGGWIGPIAQGVSTKLPLALQVVGPNNWIWTVTDATAPQVKVFEFNGGSPTTLLTRSDSTSLGLVVSGDTVFVAMSSEPLGLTHESQIIAISRTSAFVPVAIGALTIGATLRLRDGPSGYLWAATDRNGAVRVDVLTGTMFAPAPAVEANYLSVTGAGDTIWVGTDGGAVWRIVNDVRTLDFTASGAVKGLAHAGTGVGIIAVTSSGKIYEDGTEVAAFPDGLNGVWAEPASGIAYAVGANVSALARGAGPSGAWTAIPGLIVLPTPLNAVWGCNSGDVWFVGQNTSYRYFLGTPIPVAIGPSPQAVTGTSCNDVWAGGNGGQLHHFIGTGPGAGWTSFPLDPSENIRGLTARGAGEAYSVSNQPGSWLLTLTGNASHRLEAPLGMNGIWRTADGKVWIVGANSVQVGQR